MTRRRTGLRGLNAGTGWLVALLVPVSVVAGCAGGPTTSTSGTGTTMTSGTATPGGTGPATGLAGTSWVLASYQSAGGGQTPAAAGSVATLAFAAGGRLSGSTGCNQFSGSYTTTGTDLTITLGPMTRMACTGDALNTQEAALTRLLPDVTGFRGPPTALALTGKGDGVLATYTPGLASLEGTSWTVTGVNNGRGGVEATALTENLSATFGPDGAFTGVACNNLAGTYQVTGTDGLTITKLAATLMGCPPELAALESQYTAALGEVRTYAISGDTLTLRDGGGATQITARLKA
jgi:heat shock protein HslJ